MSFGSRSILAAHPVKPDCLGRHMAEHNSRTDSMKNAAVVRNRRQISGRMRSLYLMGILILIAAVTALIVSLVPARQPEDPILARRLLLQAQSLGGQADPEQVVTALLAAQSMKLSPSGEAAQILLGADFSGYSFLSLPHDGIVNAVAFSPDEKYLASAGGDRTIHVRDVVTGQEIIHMSHHAMVLSVAFSPDGKYIASGSMDKTARIWEVATGKEVASFAHEDRVASV